MDEECAAAGAASPAEAELGAVDSAPDFFRDLKRMAKKRLLNHDFRTEVMVRVAKIAEDVGPRGLGCAVPSTTSTPTVGDPIGSGSMEGRGTFVPPAKSPEVNRPGDVEARGSYPTPEVNRPGDPIGSGPTFSPKDIPIFHTTTPNPHLSHASFPYFSCTISVVAVNHRIMCAR